MKEKPTYEELEARVQELESIESELKRLKKEVRESENLFKSLYEKAPLGYQSLDENGHFIVVNHSWLDILGYTQEEVIGKSFADFLPSEWRDHFKENFPRFKAIGEILGVEFEMVKKNGDLILVSFTGKISRDEKGNFQQTHCIFQDITERKRKEEELKKIEWMLTGKPSAQYNEAPGYGDLTALNRGGLIARSIDKDTLRDISTEYLDLLETSSAIYERNGDYAFGIFCSGWCRQLDSASRNLCRTENNEAALASGKWLCHESCWTDCSKLAIESQSPVEIKCNGGINIYAVPIFSAGEVIGAINFGHGDPPKDPAKLRSLADFYGLDPEKLAHEANAYASRPSFVIELAKQRLLSSSRLIGIMVERKRAEEAVIKSNNLLQTIINTAPVRIFYKDRDLRYMGCNSVFAKDAGVASLEDLIGKDDYQLAWKEQAELYRTDDLRVLESGIPRLSYDEPQTTSEGKQIWIRTSKVPLLNDSNEIIGVLGMYEDISDRKKAEDALLESENQISSIFRSAPIGIGSVVNRLLSKVNNRLCEMTGYDEADLIGQSSRMLYPSDEDFEFVGREKYAQIADHGTGTVETRWQKHDGTIMDVLLSSTPVNLQDHSMGVTFTALDITERKRAEAERESLQVQLTQAQKMESVGRLAGGVAHDFNNMLGVIIGLADFLLMKMAPDHPFHANLTEIRKAGERSADLTRKLLAFARKQTVAPKVLDFNDTIENMLKLLGRLIGEDIDLLWKPGYDLWPVKMDPTQIDQILANLCVNARDAIDGVGKVTIETNKASFDEDYCTQHMGFVPGDYVLLAVSDNGCGMDTETISHLFEPFFTTKELGKGTGLGLATVYGSVKQNNGFINVYSEPGQGTTFKIFLPRYAAKAATETKELKPQAAERGSETILLVEDEPAILRMTTMMLELLGYKVLAAPTPGEALRLAQEHAGGIDLVLTDVVMPEMNGRDLAKNLLSIYPDMRRLFMSGYTADVIAHQGVLDVGVHFMQKPFSLADLKMKLREALDG